MARGGISSDKADAYREAMAQKDSLTAKLRKNCSKLDSNPEDHGPGWHSQFCITHVVEVVNGGER